MGIWRKDIADEAKKQLWLAGPMVFVSVFQYSLQVISLMFVGHLDELLLAGVSLSTSLVNATGFSVLVSSHKYIILSCYISYLDIGVHHYSIIFNTYAQDIIIHVPNPLAMFELMKSKSAL